MANLRKTRQRAAIKSSIEGARRPLSPQEILAAAQPSIPSLGIATVYRAIKDLVSEGWLRAVELPGSADRYEIAALEHHHHFHCRRCDRVYDLEGCPGGIDGLAPSGYRVEAHEITLYGLCSACAG